MAFDRPNIDRILSLRYEGVAPEGFVLILDKTLDDLKTFEIWREWKDKIIELDMKNRVEIENNNKKK